VKTPIVDAHLDMAWNALAGRELELTAEELRAVEKKTTQQAMVTLPELRRGGVAVAFATLYTGTTKFDDGGVGIYEKEQPDVDARKQLDYYKRWEDDGKARIIRDRASLDAHLAAWESDDVPGIILLIEGGDSITTPDHLSEWWDAGVRVIGPAWRRTRYCGGTLTPGPLTDLGRDLVAAMKDRGVILDVSHMAEQSFWDAMDVGFHRVVATHSNARAVVPNGYPQDRHLTDDMIRALGDAGAVIGVVPANAFLDETWKPGGGELTLDAVKRHLDHEAELIGWDHLGIGSDLDGGFGREETPVELDTIADLHKIGDVVPSDAREGVLGSNWLRVLRESLP
jgi:membrane dipeptidase